jgi:hypothetical protein
MRKTIAMLVAAGALAMAANPALAHCGGSHGKSYRAAQSKKPATGKAMTAKATKPATPAPAEVTTVTGSDAVIAAGPQPEGSAFQF